MSDSSSSALRLREAARALVLSDDGGVLLVRFEFPTATRWALPGGGLEPGESHLDAIERELDEELGLIDMTIGPAVWRREHVVPFPDGRWDGQRELVHLVRVPERFEPRPRLGWDALRDEYLHEIRWWDEGDLAAANDIVFVPARLADLVPLIRAEAEAGTLPAWPRDSGV